MDNLIRSFQRNSDGSWVCTSNVEVHLPDGRIQVPTGARLVPGTRFMGADIAKWLEDEHERQRSSQLSFELQAQLK